jgi:copper chaperone CopZ
MKTLKYSLIAFLAAISGLTISAQTHNPSMNMKMVNGKTETFKVWGNCEMCKARIEKAVKEEGATSADWNMETKLLKVTFNPSKTRVDTFVKKLASVGHDTETMRAEDKAYDALPACCKYERASVNMVADYVCPMHSDVHSDKPGKCPKCGMELVKKEKTKPVTGMSMNCMTKMDMN